MMMLKNSVDGNYCFRSLELFSFLDKHEKK
jgi:hypothetical protein